MKNQVTAILVLALLALPDVRASEPGKDSIPAIVSGRVMLDVNNNGKIDAGDKGLANVIVSDGIQLVATAADGSYTLKFADDPLIPYKPAQVLALCWPSGVWPVGQRFFVRRSDIKAGESVDFLLRGQKQTLPFTFAHGSDPHDNVCGGEMFAADIAGMGDHVQFCLMTGDLGYATRDSAEKMFASLRDATRKFPIPMLHAPGNHDICDIHTTRWSEQDPLAGYGPYTKYLGPIRHSFTYAGIHFAALDWARITEDGKLQTGVPDTVIDWLKKDLARLKPGTRIFLFMHHDFRHGDDKFWDVLVEHKVELALAGHSHRNKEETRRGIKRLTTQNLCGPYRLVTVAEKGHALINRCFTGNATEHRHSYAGQCKMALPFNALKGKRGPHQEIVNREVEGSFVLPGLKARELELIAEVETATAKRFGVRVSSGAARTEVVVNRSDELLLDDIPTWAVRGRGDKHYRLQLVVTGDRLLIQVNNRVQYEKAITLKEACAVELFAEGGTALFKRVDLWQIKD